MSRLATLRMVLAFQASPKTIPQVAADCDTSEQGTRDFVKALMKEGHLEFKAWQKPGKGRSGPAAAIYEWKP